MIRRRRRLATALVAAVFFAGCNKSNLMTIGGAVTYAGKPVANGNIRFLPADGNGPTATGEIVNGQYSAKTALGRKRVEIQAYCVVGRRRHHDDPKAPMKDIHEQLLPEKYNARSELTADIVSGNAVYDFVLAQ